MDWYNDEEQFVVLTTSKCVSAMNAANREARHWFNDDELYIDSLKDCDRLLVRRDVWLGYGELTRAHIQGLLDGMVLGFEKGYAEGYKWGVQYGADGFSTCPDEKPD